MSTGIATDLVESYLKEQRYAEVILMLSADLEFIFLLKLQRQRDIKLELIDTERWSMSRSINWLDKYGLLKKEDKELIIKFKKLRNIITHQRHILNNLDIEELEIINKTLKLIIKFLRQYQAEGSKKEYEEELYQYFQKKSSELKNTLKELQTMIKNINKSTV